MSSNKVLDKTGLTYLWSKIVAYIGNIFSAIGNTPMGTTATTITGAIAEHEQDISDLNSKITKSSVTLTPQNDITINSSQAYRIGNIIIVYARFTLRYQIADYGNLIHFGGDSAATGGFAMALSDTLVPLTGKSFYWDFQNKYIRTAQTLPTGTYRTYAVILV